MNAALDAVFSRPYTKGVKRVTLSFLFALAWLGCSRPTPPPFELTIELKQDRIKLYSQPFIRFKLKNVSDEPQWVFDETFVNPANLLGSDWEERGLYIEAIDPKGKRLVSAFESGASEECKYQVLKPSESLPEPKDEKIVRFAKELAPGEILASSYFLFNKGCSSTSPPDPSWEGFAEVYHLGFVEPGKYAIRAIFDMRPPKGVPYSDDAPFWEGKVESSSLALTVIP